ELLGLQVRRDGVVMAQAAWGSAAPVDQGEHIVEASAPGKKTHRARVTLAARGARESLTIPALKDAPPEPRQSGASEKAPPEDGSGRRTLGFVVGGVGLAALGVGSFFGIRALNKAHQPTRRCNHQPGPLGRPPLA